MDYAKSISQKIVLIDGSRLTDLINEGNESVSTVNNNMKVTHFGAKAAT